MCKKNTNTRKYKEVYRYKEIQGQLGVFGFLGAIDMPIPATC